MEYFRYKTTKIPNEITIITCSNRKDSVGLLIPQLKRSNIKYINTVPLGIEFNNVMKIPYIVQSLKNVNTEYVLILDAFDVLFSEDNTNILDTFNTFNKKLVFNASKNNYPDEEIDIIKNRDMLGPFKYFNAGCCLGETSYTLDFYKKCLEIITIENPHKSEQYILRHIFNNEQNSICIDNECKIFQTLGRCKTLFDGNNWKVI